MRKKKLLKILIPIAAAVVIVLIICQFLWLHDFQYRYNVSLGVIVDGKYYYTEPHRGIYAYDPIDEKKEKVLSITKYRSACVNEEGIYYLEKGDKQKIHEIKDGEDRLINDVDKNQYTLFYFNGDEDIPLIEALNTETDEYVCLSLDTETGAVSETTEPERGRKKNKGLSILTEYGGYIFAYRESPSEENADLADLYCVDTETGEMWLMEEDIELYYAVTDGNWFFVNVPWDGANTWCYKIVYEDEMPMALELVSDDV